MADDINALIATARTLLGAGATDEQRVQAINNLGDAAVAAQLDLDYDTALRAMMAAELIIARIPDSTLEDSELKYDRPSLQAAIRGIKSQKAASVGFQSSKICYQREADTCDS